MLRIDTRVVGLKELQDRLRRKPSEIRRALVEALNATGYDALDAMKAQMAIDFRNPTPYTLNSLRLEKATAQKLFVTILPREFAGKGTPARKYLAPEIYGGDRNVKRFEIALRNVGVIPAGMYAVPGKGADMDVYGNMKPGQIVQIIAFFEGFGEQGYRANMTAKGRMKLRKGTGKRLGFEYFAVRTKSHGLGPGVYKRMVIGRGTNPITPVLIFINKPVYSKRYRWHEAGNRVARQMFARRLFEEMAKASR